MDQWLEEIRAALPELVVYQQEPMKKHTTFRVGGPADLYVCPKKQELPVILGLAKKKGLAVTVIGNGSNLLVGDKGIRGLVIEVGAQMNAVEVQGNILRARAGALLSQVAAKAAAFENCKYCGIEWSGRHGICCRNSGKHGRCSDHECGCLWRRNERCHPAGDSAYPGV